MADLNIKGLAELNAKLSTLPQRVKNNILRGALRAGGNELVKAAKANVPVRTGALKYSIKVSPRKGNVNMVAVAVQAGVLTIAKRKKTAALQDAFYARFVEYGTAHSRAKPFMRPAAESGSQAAIDAMAAYVADRLEVEAAK